ncbi:hypothetical protein BHE97_16245 [Aeromicrobium sp. PE09-221]|uniref:hypothetical protein n=1 Tax=Aeromicrobium sp. PE09-221 TaxID=1898043 RepID=UPI000B3E9440|nr:hypothetical protein [Aeromicrobium sp. PE09-221]OUZ07649.1 hypothetical protein BHE97_16245 [Aeromicrobium sp. PE09-221]
MSTWTLRDRRRDLIIENIGGGAVRATCDGELIEERSAGAFDDTEIGLGTVDDDIEQTVLIGLNARRSIRSVRLVECSAGTGTTRIDFVPPAGTRARRRYDWRERHPHLFAARHVLTTGLGMLIGLLGISALLSAFFRGLLPRIDWSWLPDLPDISPPDWLRYIDPVYWISRLLPDWDWFGWLPDLDLSWLQYAVPFTVAVVIGLGELERRRKRQEREREADDGSPD